VDPARFEQIFVNLLTNALKYTPTGGTVTIRLGRECDALRLSVHDTGIGIAPDQLRRIFDLFVQGPQVEGRAAGGLGVGLSMARLLAELHGGTIEAYSSGPGLGAEFVARIPLEGRQTPE
jgi:signal transduction histidine kinase